MPDRILKARIVKSESINALSWLEEAFFYRLIVQCDDFGRFDGDPAVVRALCFPKRLRQVSEAQVVKMLGHLCELGMLQLYVVDGTSFVQMLNWSKHQRQRAAVSKYPAPPTDDGSRRHVTSSDRNGQRTTSDVAVFEVPGKPRTPRETSNAIATAAGRGVTRRSPDPPWDAFAAETRFTAVGLSKSRRQALNGMLQSIRRTLKAEGFESPSDQATEMRRRGEEWRGRYPEIPLTPETFTRRISELGQPFVRGPTSPVERLTAQAQELREREEARDASERSSRTGPGSVRGLPSA